MVPTLFIVLDKLPTNQNGKIDRNQLPTPNFSLFSSSMNEERELCTEMEHRVCSIWCSLLSHVESISKNESFFSVGGNSLLLIKLYHMYQTTFSFCTNTLTISEFFLRSTVAEHASLLTEHATVQNEVLNNSWKSINIIEGIASFAQTRIYLDEHVRFAEQKTISKTAVYHMPFAFDINEGASVSLSRLRRSLGSVLNKHASLRTRVTLDENETGIVRQKVLDLFELPILVSLQINNEQYLEEILHDEMTNSDIFNIEQGHVFRCHIVRRNSIKSYEDDLLPGDIVIFNFHHISFDGVSLYVFLQDLQRAYTTDSELEFTSLQYIDYSVYEHQLNMEESNIFWHNHLNDFTNSNVFILPCDRYPRDLNMRSGRGTTVHFELSKSLSDKIFSTAEQYKLTLFQIGLASFYVFLFKLTEQTDLCTLSVNANRYRPELEDMIGFFVNTLPYRIKIDPMLCFFRFMQEVQAQCLAILPHCHVPYQDIIANNFLSQTLFAVEQIDGPKSVDFYELSDNATLRSLVLKNQDTSAKFDLSCDFSYSIQGPSIIVSLNASLDLFDQTTIEKMARRFEFLFDNIFPSKHLYETSLLFDDDQKFLHHFNNLYANNDNIDCIHHEIIRQADKSPQMIAIILENQTLSYGELLYFAQQLGSHLVINNGVGLGHVVCQLLERSIETVIGILAIWMIGGVYAPLNSRDPEARLKTCLAMTHTRCILAHFATRNIISDPCYLVVEIDQILYHSHSTNNELCSINVIPEHLSHIVFTSGSTGTPKAVQLRHRNFVSYIHSYIIQPNEITLHHTAVTFDAHLEEIVGPLIKGGQVIILPPDAHLDMNILSTTIMRHQVTYLGGVPTQLTLLEKFIKTCNSDCLMTLRTISSGGESLLTSTVQNLLPYLNTTCQFYNCYGPAECTEGAIQYLVRKDELIFNTVVPIGQPMLHVQVHLLDDYLQPTIPSIQIGEIFIGGAGVFAGYCNEFDDHDSAKVLFMFDKQIFYRTGDFAKLNVQSKLLEFKGRRDYQVKLRGQRIDLGEIESTILAATPFVQNCVVMKQEAQDAYDNDAFLVAYLTAHQNSVDDKDKLCEQIAFYCQQHLPTYMVPLRWSFLDSFPTNQNGKIDRKLLPYVKRTPYQKIVSQPTTSLERQLRQIFSKAFSIESDVIDVTLSFEQLGGTSLGIIRALSLIQHSVYKHMDIHLLLTNPSVRQLGMKIESLLYLHDNELHEMIEYDDSSLYLQPSLFIEAFAMLLLMILWIFPVWIAYTSMLPIVMIVLFIVSFHLFTYTILVHILKPFVKEQDQELFSFSYYAWWFLSRLWTLNSTFWLCSLVGTPFYNAYLRMCGAHIGNNVHIYTVLIDAPWLIDISEETFIGEEVYFNHISYQNKTFELRRILIGRSCFIGAYSVLYEGAAMRDGSFVESYSAVKGNFIGSDVQYTSCSYRPTWVLIFQFLSLLAVTTVYAMSLKIVFAIHVPMIPLLLSVPLRFLLWILLSATIALLALKFVAGKIEFGNYSFYSWSYLRCLWFRRLIISFFYYPLSQIVCGYQRFSLVILSWLGMDIRGTNIEIADVIPFLLYPSHLVSIDDDVTTFGGVHLLPFYINTNGQCVVDSIKLGRGVTLGNHCLIHPGVHLPSGTLVATLTRVTQNTECADGKVLLGLPARSMPFIQPSSISNSYSTTSRFTVFKAVVLEIIANTIPLLIVSSIQLESMKNYFFIILFMFVLIYSILVCGLNRYCVQTKPGAYSFEETTSNWCHVLIVKMTINWTNLLEPFLGGTQWLIFLARGLGVRIKGSDVILSSLSNVTDYHLITIGEHVRMHNRAILQCHTFEQRVYKLAPIIVGPRSIIKSTSFILPGAKLDGANVIEPLTLIMKEEHLREGIHYYGNPARTQPGNITY